MNKYQNALDELCYYAMEIEIDYDYDDNRIVDYVHLNEDDLKRLKDPLQELVDKDTSKNVVKCANYRGYYYRCPTCGNDLGVYSDIEKYCDNCGQRLMRGDKND
jgi:rRNA maturation endonuclease Nob1